MVTKRTRIRIKAFIFQHSPAIFEEILTLEDKECNCAISARMTASKCIALYEGGCRCAAIVVKNGFICPPLPYTITQKERDRATKENNSPTGIRVESVNNIIGKRKVKKKYERGQCKGCGRENVLIVSVAVKHCGRCKSRFAKGIPLEAPNYAGRKKVEEWMTKN